jgi:hypothetical protein
MSIESFMRKHSRLRILLTKTTKEFHQTLEEAFRIPRKALDPLVKT